MIDALSGQLFGDSCRDAANWPEHVSLSFNFSPTQLSDKNFAQDVLTILADTGLPPHRLEAEITESAIVSDFEATRHAIQTLRSAGVRVVIDDFGTGYSGLSQLYELRFDKLKVDKRFIQQIGKAPKAISSCELYSVSVKVSICALPPKALKLSPKPMLYLRMVRTRARDFYSAKPCPLMQLRSCSLASRRRNSLRDFRVTPEGATTSATAERAHPQPCGIESGAPASCSMQSP